MPPAISFHDVGMCFRMHREKVTTLKEAVLGRFRHVRDVDEFWALRDVSFEIRGGESVAIIGHNGSGKSTTLRIAAGVLRPTHGTARVEGRVSPLIELAAGFDPDLSGRDNVFLNGALLGHSRRDMARRFDRIVEFAELGEFIDVPVKNYSSGMYARLGFAIAVDVHHEILMVDEVLAVGDERFQEKCMARIREIRASGCTILYVSHDMAGVKELCPRVLVMHHGRLEFDGPPDPAIARYRELQHLAPPGRQQHG
jgi:ABC-type polysaccharide/polyol phosphate transport system ATPase subunit